MKLDSLWLARRCLVTLILGGPVVSAAGCGSGDSDSGGFSGGSDATGAESSTTGGEDPTTTGGETGPGGDGDGDGDGDGSETSGGPPKLDVGNGADGGSGAECEVLEFEGKPEPPQVVLVLDASGSMGGFDTEYDNMVMSRWDALRLTVEALVDEFDDKVDLGAELFPKGVSVADHCAAFDPITVPVAPLNGAQVLAGIPPKSLGGATPTTPAVKIAHQHLQDVVDGRPQAMILVTDGGVNCQSTPKAVATVLAGAFAGGIPTYVVGFDADDAELKKQLELFAEAGGVPLPGDPNYYDAQDGDQLAIDLQGIIETVISCTVDLAPPPEYPDNVSIEVDGKEWPMIQDCDAEDGWIYSQQFDQITLCGAACDELKNAGSADIIYHCPEG